MKSLVIKLLHRLLGYERYLNLFSIFKIQTLHLDSRKSDFIFFENNLSDHANIVVIGACTGITTVPLAKKFSTRTVFAYEPLLSNFTALGQIICYYRLQNVQLFQTGLGNKQEEKEIILPVINGVRKQGLAHIKDRSITDYNEGFSEKLTIHCLDDRKELHDVAIEGIKLVAENFEYEILEGARKLIQKNKPLIYCELWHNERRQRVIDLITSFQYTVHYRNGNSLVPYTNDSYTGKNFFFTPNS